MTHEDMLQHIYNPEPFLREIPPAQDFRSWLPRDPAAPYDRTARGLTKPLARPVFGVSVGYHTTLALEPLFFWYDYLTDMRLEVDVQVLEPVEEAADAPRPLCAVVPGPGGAEV